MAVTVQQIFDIAIHLMDSQNESTSSTDGGHQGVQAADGEPAEQRSG